MSFQEISPPSPEKIIEFPEESGPCLVVVPRLQIFTDEVKHWRGIEKVGSSSARGSVAKELLKDLRSVALGRAAIELMVAGYAPYDPITAGRWWGKSLQLMGQTRLLREVFAQLEGQDLYFDNDSRVEVAVDYFDTDYERSGMHVTDDFMRELEMSPIGLNESRYYEGDTVYLKVHKPANPTTALVDNFYRDYGVPFDTAAYTSIVPRLKTEFWTS